MYEYKSNLRIRIQATLSNVFPKFGITVNDESRQLREMIIEKIIETTGKHLDDKERELEIREKRVLAIEETIINFRNLIQSV